MIETTSSTTPDTRPAVLVTGAARGIGRAIALDLARDHRVAFTWFSARSEAEALAALGLHPIRADFTDPAAPEQVIDQTIAALGPLSGLVNNAGAIANTDIDAYDLAQAEAIFRTNLHAPLALISCALPHLTPDAAIVNITSINARSPAASAVAYSASKAALENATLGMAKALGPREIRINAVSPGAVERDHAPRPADLQQAFLKETALPHLTEADDIAAATRFLLSPAARAITGTILPVSGGFRL